MVQPPERLCQCLSEKYFVRTGSQGSVSEGRTPIWVENQVKHLPSLLGTDFLINADSIFRVSSSCVSEMSMTPKDSFPLLLLF